MNLIYVFCRIKLLILGMWWSMLSGLLEVYFSYCNPSCPSVGWLVCHNFLKGQEVTLPCSCLRKGNYEVLLEKERKRGGAGIPGRKRTAQDKGNGRKEGNIKSEKEYAKLKILVQKQ